MASAKSALAGAVSGILAGVLDGTTVATNARMDAVKKFAVDGVMGVLGHPFVPYIALLFALLRSL